LYYTRKLKKFLIAID